MIAKSDAPTQRRRFSPNTPDLLGDYNAWAQQAIATPTNQGTLWPMPVSLNVSVVPLAALSAGAVGQVVEGAEAPWNWQPGGPVMVTVPDSASPPAFAHERPHPDWRRV